MWKEKIFQGPGLENQAVEFINKHNLKPGEWQVISAETLLAFSEIHIAYYVETKKPV